MIPGIAADAALKELKKLNEKGIAYPLGLTEEQNYEGLLPLVGLAYASYPYAKSFYEFLQAVYAYLQQMVGDVSDVGRWVSNPSNVSTEPIMPVEVI